MSTAASDWIDLRSSNLYAEIDPLGAQLSTLRDAVGNDLLWNGDPAVWSGRSPILFPIVGALHGGQYQWRGQRYQLPRHGFARGRRFEVIKNDRHEALLRLTADAQSKQVYPFSFELDVSYRCEGAALVIEATARNTGNEPMPASLGFHPALRWPLPYGQPRGDHFLQFEFDESAPIRRLDARGLLTHERMATPVRGKQLRLRDTLFTDDVVIFDELVSRRVIYGAAVGPRILVSYPNATHLGVWSKPGAGFVCIEPWRGVADPVDFDGALNTKPGVFRVAPGARQGLQMRIEWLPA
jgi:galactose mutarotase-like enzyme